MTVVSAGQAAGLGAREGGSIFEPPVYYRSIAGRLQLAAKRAVDVVGAATGLLVLSPLLAAISAGVWLDSGRPIFFRWLVVGRGGRPFTGYKFRSMVPGAAAMLGKLADRNEMRGPVFKMKADPRVTQVGRWLRRYSLDELPQLWSVLKGDMSLVGPRPPLQSEWEHFEPWQRRKLAVKPGMTCLWQVSGRADITEFAEWVRLDLEYVERWSLILDLRILVATLGAALGGRGAY